LPKEEIDRMIKEAEEHAAEDAKRREEAETRNAAEALVYSTEQLLTDNAEKLPEDVTTEVREAVGALRTALEGEDVAEVKAKQEQLAKVSQKIGEALYAASSAEQPAGTASAGQASGQGGASDEDVVDAEIIDEDEQGESK